MPKCEWCGEDGCIGKDAHFYDCETCDGARGWDRSKDCEVYDDWMDCPDCEGTGSMEYEN